MLIVGLVLLVLAVVLGTGIALSNTDSVSAEAFGVSLSDVTIGGVFLVGVAVGAVALLGLALILAGAARKRARRRALKSEIRRQRDEQESLAEQNARLQAELERERAAAMPPYADQPGTAGTPAPVAGTSTRTATTADEGEARHGRHGVS